MATKTYGDSPAGDRRSARELRESGVGSSKNLPARTKIANSRKARQMEAAEKARREARYNGQTTDSNN